MEKRTINYDDVLPGYVKLYISDKKFSELKYISAYFSEKLKNKSSNYNEYFKEVGHWLSGLTLSNLTPEEKKIIKADMLCSDEDFRRFMLDPKNVDLFVALGMFFEIINYVKRLLDSNSSTDFLGTAMSLADKITNHLVSSYAKFFGLPEELVCAEDLINKINCIYSFQYGVLYSDKQIPTYRRKRTGQ